MKCKNSGNSYWFHFFQDLVFNGVLASLDGGAVKTYIAIKAHANLNDGLCGPGLERIGSLVGHSRRQVQRHIEALEAAGLLRHEKRGRRNVYWIQEKFLINDATAAWEYVPKHVRDLPEAFQVVSRGGANPELMLRMEQITTTLKLSIALPEAADDPLAMAHTIGGKMGEVLMRHLDQRK